MGEKINHVYLVMHDSSMNEPMAVVSVWTAREDADQEAERINNLEGKYQHRIGRYVVEEVALNAPSTNPLN